MSYCYLHWAEESLCKLKMMTFIKFKGQQRSNVVNYVLWLPYLVTRTAETMVKESKVKERSNFTKYRRNVRLCSDLFTDLVSFVIPAAGIKTKRSAVVHIDTEYRSMQKLQIYHVWSLFGVTPGVYFFSFFFFFCTILEQSISNKMVSKIQVGMSTTDIYLHYTAIFFYCHL